MQLDRRLLYFTTEIAWLLDLPVHDRRMVTAHGRKETVWCNMSIIGDFTSTRWTIEGWLLDDESVLALELEFPTHFREELLVVFAEIVGSFDKSS